MTDWGTYNVKQFGARGDGTADDTRAIQRASEASLDNHHRGAVWFPPGRYRITEPIAFPDSGEFSIIFRGVGNLSQIYGEFGGYLIDRFPQPFNPCTGIKVFENLSFENNHAEAGCVRMASSINTRFSSCRFRGPRGITMEGEEGRAGQSWTIEDCDLKGAGWSEDKTNGKGFGICTGGNAVISGCDIVGFDTGVYAWGYGVVLLGPRIEVNGTGVTVGLSENDHVAIGCSGFTLIGGSFESNKTGIDFRSGGGQGIISGLTIHGFEGACIDGSDPQYGIRYRGGGAAHSMLTTGISVGGQMAQACIAIEDGPQPARLAFVACTASNGSTKGGERWRLPTRAHIATFIDCAEATGTVTKMLLPTYKFAGLPEAIYTPDGQEYNITDSVTDVWGEDVQGGGTHSVKVRYNAAVDRWRVIGR